MTTAIKRTTRVPVLDSVRKERGELAEGLGKAKSSRESRDILTRISVLDNLLLPGHDAIFVPGLDLSVAGLRVRKNSSRTRMSVSGLIRNTGGRRIKQLFRVVIGVSYAPPSGQPVSREVIVTVPASTTIERGETYETEPFPNIELFYKPNGVSIRYTLELLVDLNNLIHEIREGQDNYLSLPYVTSIAR